MSRYLIGENDNYFTAVLPDNIRVAINAVRRNNHGQDLVHLKHSEPFVRQHSLVCFLDLAMYWNG